MNSIKKMALLYWILVNIIGLNAQSLNVEDINASLLKGANAVMRYNETILTINSYEKYELQKHYAVTIFNEAAFKNYGDLSIYYSKLNPLKDIEATIYDANGKVLKKLKNADITDYRPDSFSESISDSKLRIIKFDKKAYQYPITIEYKIETAGQTMFIPAWNPIEDNYTAFEKASFIFKYSPDVSFKLKELNVKSLPQNNDPNSTYKTLEWNIKDVPYKESESLSVTQTTPFVQVFTNVIMLGNFASKTSTWQQISEFDFNINKDRDKLPPNTKAEINRIVKNTGSSKTDLIKAIYEYMQEHTRYQSIQLGVGGWVTIPAQDVAEKGFGDCKALTNYMIAMLKEAGITGYAALVNAGKKSYNQHFQFPEIPHMSFNHVICCVPIEKDSLWLECTSQEEPAGYLGDFTGNRKALLIKPTGGELINTINYTPKDHSQTKIYNIEINEEGSGKFKMIRRSKGRYADEIFSIKAQNADEQTKWLLAEMNYPDIKINNLKFEVKKAKIPTSTDNFEAEITRMASKSGKRLFVKVPTMMESYGIVMADSLRETDLYLNPCVYTSEVVDSCNVTLPNTHKIESLPKEIVELHSFGELKSKYEKVNDQTIKYTRLLSIKGGIYNKNLFEAYQKFIKKINQSDNQKIVAVLKE